MNKYSAYIHTLYIELENKADLLPLSHKMLNDDTLSDKDKSILQKEWWILSDYALHCKTVECQEDIIVYGKERIASTSNVFLLTFNSTPILFSKLYIPPLSKALASISTISPSSSEKD